MERSGDRTPSRRARGLGTLYHDAARRRWVGAVTIGGRRRKVVAKTKTDASARLADLVAARASGAPIDDRNHTVAQAVDVWLRRELPARRRNGRPLAPATITGYRWAAGLIVDRLGKMRLADVTVEDVEQFYDDLMALGDDGPDAAASLRKVRTTLNQVITLAVRRRKISHNVAAVATMPADATEAEGRTALKPEEARKLLEELRHEPYGLMFALSLRLGLRPGEAAAVAWDDVTTIDDTRPARDRRRRRGPGGGRLALTVRRGRRSVGGKQEVVDELKTEASRRTIELPPDLAEWVEAHRDATFGNTTPIHVDALLMFPSATGRVLDPSNVRRDLAAICERAGVPVVSPNELRHSCASLLSDEGVPNELIADLLGHATTRMVDQTYRHRLRPVVDVAARASWASGTG